MATGGLWILAGWIGQPLAKTNQIRHVDQDGNTVGTSAGGLLPLLCLFVFVVSFLWPLFLALGAVVESSWPDLG